MCPWIQASLSTSSPQFHRWIQASRSTSSPQFHRWIQASSLFYVLNLTVGFLTSKLQYSFFSGKI
jgi:hypothetical protein